MQVLPAWSALGKLGRSKLVSATVFIPVIGFFILFNEQVISFLQMSSGVLNIGEEELKKISSHSLKNLYFGLSSLAVASVIFKLRCPSSIQEYGTMENFISSNIKYMDRQLCEELTKKATNTKCSKIKESTLNRLKAYVVIYEDPGKAKIPQAGTDFVYADLSHDMWVQLHKMHFTSLLRTIFIQDEHDHGIAKFFTTLLYVLGFVVIGYSSVRVFLAILEKTFFG